MDELTMKISPLEQYLSVAQENQTPKKIKDMTIAEYLEYEKKNIQHFEEKDDVDEWLNAEITKHMSMLAVENMKDALISIIKSIRHEIEDGIMKRQIDASTTSVSDEVSSIASNNHNLYATATLDAKDNFMPQRVYEYLEFPCNFVINVAEDVIILGRPFLESTRAQIDVFNEEIFIRIGSQ
ncbi:hypothetical protein Tco_0012643 [Tanacetum coccineum]